MFLGLGEVILGFKVVNQGEANETVFISNPHTTNWKEGVIWLLL